MSTERKPQEPRSGDASPETAPSPDYRQSSRHGRERGLRVYIPADVLALAGVDPHAPEPPYSVQAVREEPGRRRRSVLVRLYPG